MEDRFTRQIGLLGHDVQRQIRSVRVAVFGLGGLGSFVAYLLACIGVGEIFLIDFDKVATSDLNRQILYGYRVINRYKAAVAYRRLAEYANDIVLEPITTKVEYNKLVSNIVRKVDFVFDCLDNVESRFILNDMCVVNRKVMIHGGVSGFRGQVMAVIPGYTPCLRCIIRGGVRQQRVNVIATSCAVVAAFQVQLFINLIRGSTCREMYIIDLEELRVITYKLPAVDNCDKCTRVRSFSE